LNNRKIEVIKHTKEAENTTRLKWKQLESNIKINANLNFRYRCHKTGKFTDICNSFKVHIRIYDVMN